MVTLETEYTLRTVSLVATVAKVFIRFLVFLASTIIISTGLEVVWALVALNSFMLKSNLILIRIMVHLVMLHAEVGSIVDAENVG